MGADRFNRDDVGRFSRQSSGRIPPTAAAPSNTQPTSKTPDNSPRSVDQHRADSYEDMWRRSRRNAQVHAYNYALTRYDDHDIVWGTVWATDERHASDLVAASWVERGYRDGEFSISQVSRSTDEGFADASEVYRDILGSQSGRWLLRENPHPSVESGGWVAVNAVHERLMISRVGRRWRLTEWDPGDGLSSPTTLHLGDFDSAAECVTAADARLS